MQRLRNLKNSDQDKQTEHHTKACNIKLLKINTKKEDLKTARGEKPIMCRNGAALPSNCR